MDFFLKSNPESKPKRIVKTLKKESILDSRFLIFEASIPESILYFEESTQGRSKNPSFVDVICGWSPGSLNGPFTEHCVYVLGRETSTLGWQWSADPNNSDEYRFDCRMADPRCA